ncbi:hypothetical protein GW17_00045783 [Ensete ventricosum]|nr:hypothetical protein GW17_00045783 [Ensete ventricosum]
MLPLRFPNSGIRAKQRQRGKRVVGHGQSLCKGGWPWPGPLQGQLAMPLPTIRGWTTAARASPRGRSTTPARGSSPQGQCPPTASPQRGGDHGGATCRSRASRRGDRPLARQLPTGKAAVAEGTKGLGHSF